MMKNDQVDRWKKEELDVWNEDIIIQALRLIPEVSKIIWKLEWLNLELKPAKISFRMSKLEYRIAYTSKGLIESNELQRNFQNSSFGPKLEFSSKHQKISVSKILILLINIQMLTQMIYNTS